MKQKLPIIIVCLIVIAVAVVYFGRRSESGGGLDEVRIGILADQTGFMSPQGKSIEKGVRVAESEINETGGIQGKKLRLFFADGATDPPIAAQRAKELIERNNVDVVVGTTSSATTLAVLDVTTKAKIPLIYSPHGECKTCMPGAAEAVNPFVYGSGWTERMAAGSMLKYLKDEMFADIETPSVYFVGGDYVYPRSTNAYAKTVAEGLGFEVIGDEYSPTSTSDYSPVIRRILEAEPDLLIVTNPGDSGVTFMKQATQFKVMERMKVSGFATFDQEMVEAMGPVSEGVYCINRYSRLLDNDENRKFLARYRKMYPNDKYLPGPTCAGGGYGSFMVLAEALRSADPNDIETFRKALESVEINLPQGPVRVNAQNHIFDQHLYILQIRNSTYHVIADLGMQMHPGFEGCSVK